MLSLLIDWFHTFLLLDIINPSFRSEEITSLESTGSHGMSEDRKTPTKELQGCRSQRKMRTVSVAAGSGGLLLLTVITFSS